VCSPPCVSHGQTRCRSRCRQRLLSALARPRRAGVRPGDQGDLAAAHPGSKMVHPPVGRLREDLDRERGEALEEPAKEAAVARLQRVEVISTQQARGAPLHEAAARAAAARWWQGSRVKAPRWLLVRIHAGTWPRTWSAGGARCTAASWSSPGARRPVGARCPTWGGRAALRRLAADGHRRRSPTGRRQPGGPGRRRAGAPSRSGVPPWRTSRPFGLSSKMASSCGNSSSNSSLMALRR
jgi:hypothetical protein